MTRRVGATVVPRAKMQPAIWCRGKCDHALSFAHRPRLQDCLDWTHLHHAQYGQSKAWTQNSNFGEQHLTKVTDYVDCAMPNQEIVRRFFWVHDREYKCMAPGPAIPVGWFSWGEPDVFSVLWGYAYVAIRNKFFGKSWVLITAFLAVPAPFPILVAGIFAWLTRQREQSCSAVFFIVCWGSGLTVIDVLVGMAQGISDFKSSKKSDDSEPTCSLKLAVKVAWVLFDASINVYNAIISLKEVEEDITCGYDSWLKAIAYTNILNACLGTLSLCAVHMCKISQPK
eukprot:3035667-Rhodomonas_salina.5